jgi:hypothetical protein
LMIFSLLVEGPLPISWFVMQKYAFIAIIAFVSAKKQVDFCYFNDYLYFCVVVRRV